MMANNETQVWRTSLVEQLMASTGSISVLHAPAGFGKTSRLNDLADALRQRGRHVVTDLKAACSESKSWLLLDEPDPEKLNAAILRERLSAARAVGTGIAVATRDIDQLPLARLQAEGLVERFGPRQLRLDHRATLAALRPVVGAKYGDMAARLIDGWPAALTLLRNYLRDPSARLDLDGDFLGPSGVKAYISQEILPGLLPEWRQALMFASVVEGCDGSILEVMRPGEDLRRHLVSVKERLLGLVDDVDDATRLHPLLRLHLRQQFDQLPSSVRASVLERASEHCARIGRLSQAAELISRVGQAGAIVDFVRRSQGLRLWVIAGVDVIRAIVNCADLQALQDEPRLKLMKCLIHLKDGEIDAAERLFDSISCQLAEDKEAQCDVELVRASLAIYGCRPMNEEDVAAIRRNILSNSDDPAWQAIVLSMQAILNVQRGDLDEGVSNIVAGAAQARAAGTAYNLLFFDIHLTNVALARGEIDQARKILGQVRKACRQNFPSDVGLQTIVDALTSSLEFESGRLSSARHLIRRSTHRVSQVEAWLDVYAATYEPTARLLVSDLGLGSALATLKAQQEVLEARGLARIASMVSAIAACLQGESSLCGISTEHVVAPTPAVPEALMTWQERELFGLADAYERLSAGDPAGAATGLRLLLAFAEARGLQRTALRVRLLLVAALDGQDGDEANLILDVALAFGASSGMNRAFVEFGGTAVRDRLLRRLAAARADLVVEPAMAKLLRALGRWLEAPVAVSSAALTVRECDVLMALEQGGSDKLIGRRLGVSEHAVRYHLKNLFRKLRVHDRVSAISQARHAGLLS